MTAPSNDPHEVPGFTQAVFCVNHMAKLEGITITPAEVEKICVIALAVYRPYVQAETYADIADDQSLMAGYQKLAVELDMISAALRERLP